MSDDKKEQAKRKQAPRVPSAIQFPYTDMSDGLQVADGLMKGGGVPMTRDQLAAAMGQAPGGGGFATKIATARIFGIMESVGGKYALTELGHEIMDPSRQQEAKVKAFMNVELFKRTYDEFRGRLLPPRPTGLDAAFMNFGVTAKLVRFARLAFEKSARMAGMYPNGNEDRLVIPIAAPLAFSPEQVQAAVERNDAAERTDSPAPASRPMAAKPLEYQLVDLLGLDGIGDEENQAIWTLVRFLGSRKKD